MSVSIHYQAIIPVDGVLYRLHAAVRDACTQANVSIPPETAAFFDDQNEQREVTEDGIRIDIDQYSKVKAGRGSVMNDGEAIIDLAKLPPGATKIRIYASH